MEYHVTFIKKKKKKKTYNIRYEEIILRALDGVNCVLIGYGQTGSGKSFTIGGFKNNCKVCFPYFRII